MTERRPPDNSGDTLLQQRVRLKRPDMYKVIMHNDDFTTMDFVVKVLVGIFHKQAAEATKIMLDIHNKGKGIAGVFTYDIAASKITQVHAFAKENGFPLKCSIEKA